MFRSAICGASEVLHSRVGIHVFDKNSKTLPPAAAGFWAAGFWDHSPFLGCGRRANERSEGATRAERGVAVPVSERVGEFEGRSPSMVRMLRKLRMRRINSPLGWTMAALIAAAALVSAQGRGGGAWTTVGGDAQRTSFVRTDPKISLPAMQAPGFQFLWKRKLDTERLTQPLLLPNIIAYKGFKALAFIGSASGHVYSIDYDLNRMFWEQKLATSAPRAAACSSGVPVLTKATPLTPPAGRGGANRGAGPGDN